jgi:hypothetical protein
MILVPRMSPHEVWLVSFDIMAVLVWGGQLRRAVLPAGEKLEHQFVNVAVAIMCAIARCCEVRAAQGQWLRHKSTRLPHVGRHFSKTSMVCGLEGLDMSGSNQALRPCIAPPLQAGCRRQLPTLLGQGLRPPPRNA